MHLPDIDVLTAGLCRYRSAPANQIRRAVQDDNRERVHAALRDYCRPSVWQRIWRIVRRGR